MKNHGAAIVASKHMLKVPEKWSGGLRATAWTIGIPDTKSQYSGLTPLATKLKSQEGPHLRRYQRRWLFERFFAWWQWKRRLLFRREYFATNFLGSVLLASITMLLKRY